MRRGPGRGLYFVVTLSDLKQAGYKAREAKASGLPMTISYAKQWDFVEGLKEAGFQLKEVMGAGYKTPRRNFSAVGFIFPHLRSREKIVAFE